MATKKQKRAEALAKRENGLRAQAMDRHNRDMMKQVIAEGAKALNDRYREILARHGIHE